MKRTVLEMLNLACENFNGQQYTADKSDSGWVKSSFNDINSLSDKLAVALINQNIQPQDNISIIAEGRTSWIVCEYAFLKVNAVSVPLSVKLQPDELLFRIEHSQSKAVVVSHNSLSKIFSMSDKLISMGVKLIYLDPSGPDILTLSYKGLNILYYDDLIDFGTQNFESYKNTLYSRIASVNEDDVVTISYTSGTTGNPKGIMLTHLNYWANAHSALGYFRLANNMKMLVILPIDHSFAHTVAIYVATLCSMHLYFVDTRGGATKQLKNIPINIREVNPDFMLSVPALTGNFMRKIQDTVNDKGGLAKFLFNAGMKAGFKIIGNGFDKTPLLSRLVNYPVYKIADLIVFKKVREIFGTDFQFFIGGGAALDYKQQQFFHTLGTPVFQGYGLSEAAPIISVNVTYRYKFGSSGGPLTGEEVTIVDDNGNPVPVGTKGIVTVKGLNVMKGYFKNEKATAEAVKDGRLDTGDMGYIDKDGFLYVTGREKALLISCDGEKYSPEGIEEAILNCGDLLFQVILYNDHCRYTTALVTLDNKRVSDYVAKHKIKDTDTLLEAVKKSFYAFTRSSEYADKFPKQWIPSVFRICEPFTEQNQMVNSTMKIVRFKILQHFQPVLDEMLTPEGKVDNSENKKFLQHFIDN